jgi:hypothetical protein
LLEIWRLEAQMPRIKTKGKIMQYPVTSRQSAQDYEAALLLQAQVLSKAWRRFGAQAFASLAALFISVATIGGVAMLPIEPASAVKTNSASPATQSAPVAEPSYPMLRGPFM